MQLVPFTSDYDQSFTTTLDGVRYVIDARWNERGQVWTFDLTRESDQVLLLAGVSMLSGQDLLAPYALGIGGLVVTDLSNNSTDPGPDDLGDRAAVVFLNNDELQILFDAGFPGIVSPGVVPSATSAAPSVPAPAATPTPAPAPGGTSGGTTVVNQTTNITNNVIAQTTIAGGFTDGRPYADDGSTGTEVLAYQFLYNAGAHPGSVLKLSVLALGSGAGTVRAYMGGTFGTLGDVGTPSGTLVGNAPITLLAPIVILSGASFGNPGGIIPIKITVQSAGIGTAVGIQPVLSGVVS